MLYKYAVLVVFKSLQNYFKKSMQDDGKYDSECQSKCFFFKPFFVPQNYLRWTGKNYFTGDACFTVLEMWYH